MPLLRSAEAPRGLRERAVLGQGTAAPPAALLCSPPSGRVVASSRQAPCAAIPVPSACGKCFRGGERW